jgi:hypothetical protein
MDWRTVAPQPLGYGPFRCYIRLASCWGTHKLPSLRRTSWTHWQQPTLHGSVTTHGSPSEIKGIAHPVVPTNPRTASAASSLTWNASHETVRLLLKDQHASREVDDGTSPTAHIPYEITTNCMPLATWMQALRQSRFEGFCLYIPLSCRPISASVASLSDTPPDCNYVEQTQSTALVHGASLLSNAQSWRKYRVRGYRLAFPCPSLTCLAGHVLSGQRRVNPHGIVWSFGASAPLLRSTWSTREGSVLLTPAMRLFLPFRTDTFLLSIKSRRSPHPPGLGGSSGRYEKRYPSVGLR